MQSQCNPYYAALKQENGNLSSISMESTRTREPISNTTTTTTTINSTTTTTYSSSDNNNNSPSQNRNNTSQPNLKNSFQDLSNNNTNGCCVSTQQILIDEGTIDCLSLQFPSKPSVVSSSSSCPTSFKHLKVYNDNSNNAIIQQDDDEDEEEDEVDQLRIDEGTENTTPTIITSKSLLSNDATKMNSNHSSSILDTLISSTNGPSCSMSSCTVTTLTLNGPASVVASAGPLLMSGNNNFPHNFPYLSSTIANSPSRGGFLDRLFTFSPNNANYLGPLKTPNASHQDRLSLFTTSPQQKVETLSSPNGSTHSGYSSNLTNSLLSNDESPNFSNIWLNQQLKQTSIVEPLGNVNSTTAINPNNAANVLSTSNVHNNLLNRQPTHSMINNSSNAGLMDTLYSNQIKNNSSPPSQKQRNLIPSGIQKHTINQKELRRAREKTRNNIKHFLIDSATTSNNAPLATNQTKPILTAATEKNAQLNPSSPSTTSSEEQEDPIHNNIKLPSPESEVPLKQKLKMRSYKLL